MKKTKLITLSIVGSTLLLLTACGGGSSSSDAGTPPATPPTQTSKTTVPTKINIAIPDGLKNRRRGQQQLIVSKSSNQKTTDTIESYGYTQLTQTIQEVEVTIKGVKENMVYLGSMLTDIRTACEGTAINTQCSIPAGQISLTIDDSIQSDLKELESEFDDLEVEGEAPPLNTTFTMGEVLYTQFDSNHTYQQDVVFDLQPAFSDLDFNVTKMLETVRWSDDENNIETISDINDEFGAYSMHLNYAKKDDNSSFMSIKNNFTNPALDGVPASSGTFAVTLSELNDTNETIKVTSSGKYSDGTFSDSFNSAGQINSNGGYLNSNGTFDENGTYAEKETFDANGSVLQSKYCDEIVGEVNTCSIADESTWHTFDDEFGIDSDDFSEEEFADDNFDDEDSIFNSQSLVVTGGNFNDGICTLLAPDFTVTSETSPFEEAIGAIFKFEEEQEGLLEDSSFENQLDDLKIFCLDEEGNIEELSAENRPTLTIDNE